MINKVLLPTFLQLLFWICFIFLICYHKSRKKRILEEDKSVEKLEEKTETPQDKKMKAVKIVCAYTFLFWLVWYICFVLFSAFKQSNTFLSGYFIVGLLIYLLIPTLVVIIALKKVKESEEREKAESDWKQRLQKEYGHLSPEEIIFNEQIEYIDKLFLLKTIHKYQDDEAEELFDTARKEARKAKLSEAKRKISQKAQEQYSNILSDDERKPIPEEVKLYVWKRDGGKCVKCGSNENLEYDHIIPIAKGGSNTERNIQLLCEKCNREKSDSIA